MKIKTSPLTKLTLGLMVAGTIAACNQNKPSDKSAPTGIAATSGSIVYVNQDTLLSKYDYFKEQLLYLINDNITRKIMRT